MSLYISVFLPFTAARDLIYRKIGFQCDSSEHRQEADGIFHQVGNCQIGSHAL